MNKLLIILIAIIVSVFCFTLVIRIEPKNEVLKKYDGLMEDLSKRTETSRTFYDKETEQYTFVGGLQKEVSMWGVMSAWATVLVKDVYGGQFGEDKGDNVWYPDEQNLSTSQSPGLRFISVTVPRDSIITNTVLDIDAKADSDAEVGRIWMVPSDNFAGFSNGFGNVPRSIATTTNYVDWSIPGGGGVKTSPDFSTVAQEIFSRAGWASGNAIGCVMIWQSGNPGGVEWDTSPLATITITYYAPPIKPGSEAGIIIDE